MNFVNYDGIRLRFFRSKDNTKALVPLRQAAREHSRCLLTVAAALAEGIRLKVIKLPEAKKGFILLLRRWVVERSFAWTTRFRR